MMMQEIGDILLETCLGHTGIPIIIYIYNMYMNEDVPKNLLVSGSLNNVVMEMSRLMGIQDVLLASCILVTRKHEFVRHLHALESCHTCLHP